MALAISAMQLFCRTTLLFFFFLTEPLWQPTELMNWRHPNEWRGCVFSRWATVSYSVFAVKAIL